MKKHTTLDIKKLAIEQIPIGITIIDLDGHILYYNEYCSQYLDRKPEYIGKDIRSCHQKKESIKRIDNIFDRLKKGEIQEYYGSSGYRVLRINSKYRCL
ncbi:MAG: PAS domain-containing protein [Desulfobacteraceae bacterium]|nr:PAS domain-containing protein [Desulfobacteraceae bacterium]